MPSRNRGKPKPKLRDLSRHPPTEEEKQALVDAVVSENPIATAILGAVFVEHELEMTLRGRLSKNDDDTWLALTGDEGPLGTFSKKITAAYALGVCDDITRSNLNIVRAIRNAFAHAKKLIDFDNELIASELKKVRFHGKKDRADFERDSTKSLSKSLLFDRLRSRAKAPFSHADTSPPIADKAIAIRKCLAAVRSPASHRFVGMWDVRHSRPST